MTLNRGLARYAWLSVATAILIIILKIGAYLVTGSIGFLSDALESGANIAAAVITLIALLIAAKPPDQEHTYGHSKAEYLSVGAEGTFILIAAAVIAYQAVMRLMNPEPLDRIGLGLVLLAIAAAANFVVARILLRAGEQHRSAALVADAHHLLTDVWTSIGVLLGVALVGLTGWQWLDPAIALIVAIQIVYTGIKLVRMAINGLLDAAMLPEEVERVMSILNGYQEDGITFHALRTRQAGAQRFISVHIQVPGDWTVQKGHEFSENVELEIRNAFAPVNVTTHIEPVEDPVSLQDAPLNRMD